MGIRGYIRWKRRNGNIPRTVAIYLIFIFFTFTIAYYHRISQFEGSDNYWIVGSGEGFPRCNLRPPESLGEYNTFEMYRNVMGMGEMDGKSSARVSFNQTKKLKVFVLPFTHVDPGWLETFEDYTKRTNAILSNMHTFMVQNQEMRFMWAEIVFFERWWSLQNETVKKDVVELVEEGRLEFATGSWVMTDEANPYFPVSVDNIVEGMQFINENFDTKPSVIWSNDPFGYSNSIPYLFRKAGFNRSVINRIHQSLKNALQREKAIPFQWRQYFDSTGNSDILTHVLPYSHYDIPNSCGPNPDACCEFDFKRMTHWGCSGSKPSPITSANVKEKAASLVEQLKLMSDMYTSPVILMMHGDDFRYDMIEEWSQQHDNLLPLFEEINNGSAAEIRFGTFSDYFNELEAYYKENEEFRPPVLNGDFFPYMCAAYDLWTGYFTTRPFFKRQERILHNLIRSADLLLSLNFLQLSPEKRVNLSGILKEARRNLALFQHHDAITGTSRKSVMKNYSQILYNSSVKAREVMEDIMSTRYQSEFVINFKSENRITIEESVLISLEKGKERNIVIFNSLLVPLNDLVTIRVHSRYVQVFQNGTPVQCQIEPFFTNGQLTTKSYSLIFPVSLNALSIGNYTVKHVEKDPPPMVDLWAKNIEKWSNLNHVKVRKIVQPVVELNTEYLKTEHDSDDGSLVKIIRSGEEFNCEQRWIEYTNANGGAYVMRFDDVDGEKSNIRNLTSTDFVVMDGPLRKSVIQFHHVYSQRTSIKNIKGIHGNSVDIRLYVDIRKETNTELMTQFYTDWNDTDSYTDSIGLQLLRRENYGDSMQHNYYPMPTSAVLESRSKNLRLSVVSNLEHGARFPMSGGVEINIDRIMNQDDRKGLGFEMDSIANDMLPVEMDFRLVPEVVEPSMNSKVYNSHTQLASDSLLGIMYPPVIFTSEGEGVEENMGIEFPKGYQLLTIRTLPGDKKLLLTVFRHSYGCDNLKKSIGELLQRIGVSLVQRVDLSGVTAIGEVVDVDQLDFEIDVFDFLSLILFI